MEKVAVVLGVRECYAEASLTSGKGHHGISRNVFLNLKAASRLYVFPPAEKTWASFYSLYKWWRVLTLDALSTQDQGINGEIAREREKPPR